MSIVTEYAESRTLNNSPSSPHQNGPPPPSSGTRGLCGARARDCSLTDYNRVHSISRLTDFLIAKSGELTPRSTVFCYTLWSIQKTLLTSRILKPMTRSGPAAPPQSISHHRGSTTCCEL